MIRRQMICASDAEKRNKQRKVIMNENHKTIEKQVPTPDHAPSGRPSNRPSGRSEFESDETAQTRGENPSLGSDYIPYHGISFGPARAKPVNSKTKKLSREQLTEIEEHLSARDHAVLQTIRKYRFLTSNQVGSLFFADCSTKTSRSRNQNLLLQRLGDYGLIRPLERRVGGYGGGS